MAPGDAQLGDGELGEAEQVRNKADYSSNETDLEAVQDVMASLDRFMAKAERLFESERKQDND